MIAKALIDTRPDVVKHCAHDGSTPLILSSECGHVDVVRFLLETLLLKAHEMEITSLKLHFIASGKGHVEVVKNWSELEQSLNMARAIDGWTNSRRSGERARGHCLNVTRTRTNTIPNGTKASAAGLSGCACVANAHEVRRKGGGMGQTRKCKALE